MNLPHSFKTAGFLSYDEQLLRQPKRGILIGTEGRANSGKTEFYLSAPGPGMALALDRGYEQCLDNPEPPVTRREDEWAFLPVQVPLATQMNTAQYFELWKGYQKIYLETMLNKDGRSAVVDGESDSWEWQQLAAFGKLTQIPPMMRTEVNAARRAMYARAKDSGKIVIFTHRLKKEYQTVYDGAGKAIPDPLAPGKDLREWDGKSYERAGFGDHEYLFAIQLRHLYEEETTRLNTVLNRNVVTPRRWGLQILMCKPNRSLEGSQLWGEECNMPTLLQLVYPHITLADWGY